MNNGVLLGLMLATAAAVWYPLSAARAQQASAQDAPATSIPVAPAAEADDGLVSRDQVLAIMAQEVVLAPGIGLRNIRLGEPMDQVRNRLGPPTGESRSGLISNIITLTYVLDSGAAVALSGRGVVEKITVRGNSSALVRTAQGARFGMQPRQIVRIYREPSRARGERIEYTHRGISFLFEEGGVAEMDIYPRK